MTAVRLYDLLKQLALVYEVMKNTNRPTNKRRHFNKKYLQQTVIMWEASLCP